MTAQNNSNRDIDHEELTEERLNAAEQVLKEKFVKRNVSIKFLSHVKIEKTPSEIKHFYNLKSVI